MARQVIKDTKDRREQKKRRSGMFISLFLMFLFLLLMSSFVLRFVYQGASNVTITQEGVTEVFRAAIGDINYSTNESAPLDEDENYDSNYYDEETYNDEDIDGQEGYYTDGTGVYDSIQ